ncbi:MAG: mobilization protein [Ruminococcus sp.]|nr:mobilization protein [Ruminococcus sp.]
MRKRNVTITIRCTEDERQRIYSKARQHGLTLSDFVLRSALGKKIVTADGLADVLKEQKSIGRNLNAADTRSMVEITAPRIISGNPC